MALVRGWSLLVTPHQLPCSGHCVEVFYPPVTAAFRILDHLLRVVSVVVLVSRTQDLHHGDQSQGACANPIGSTGMTSYGHILRV